MIMTLITFISKVVVVVYIISIIPAIFFTYEQEKLGMKIQDTPNKFLGIVYHFISVWLITPFFFYNLFKNNKK